MGSIVINMIALEYLDAVVLAVCHKDIAGSVDSNSLETFELAIALTPTAKRAQEGSVWIENLDSVVARVGYKDESLLVDSHTPAQCTSIVG